MIQDAVAGPGGGRRRATVFPIAERLRSGYAAGCADGIGSTIP